MKALVAAVSLCLSTLAVAGPHEHRVHHRLHHQMHHFHYHKPHVRHHHSWIVPAIIGGAVVYAATRPDPVIVHQPAMIVQPNQVVIDGVIYTKQIMIIDGVQQEVLIKQ